MPPDSRWLLRATLALLVTIFGCDDVSAPKDDAGAPAAPAEAGQPPDAGLPNDAGPADAGPPVAPVAPVALCPRPGATGVPTNTVLRLELDAGPPLWSVSSQPIIVQVEGVVTEALAHGQGNSLVVVPTEPLPPGARVDVLLAALEDAEGRPVALDGGSWSFIVGSGPAEGPGFAFSKPWTPYGGESGGAFGLISDGEASLLAFSTPYTLWAHRIADGGTTKARYLHDGMFANQLLMAASTDTLYVTWTYFDYTQPGSLALDRVDRLLSRPPLPSLGLSPASLGSAVAIGPDGGVVIAFDIDTDVWPIGGARIMRSYDTGNTWSDSVEIDPVASCPDILYVGNRLLVAWTAWGIVGGRDLWTAYSDDEGQTFSTPTAVFHSPVWAFCPKLHDTRDGSFVVSWDAPNESSTARGPWALRVDGDGGLVQAARPLLPELPSGSCVMLTVNERGRALLARSHGDIGSDNWVTEIFRDVDGGLQFSESSPVSIIPPGEYCPVLAFHPSGNLDIAWVRLVDSHLFVSSGTANRPCEP